MSDRTSHVLVYDPTGVLVAWWRNAPLPVFSVRTAGIEPVTIRLPLDASGSLPLGLAWQNRVDIYSTTDFSQARAVGVDFYGAGVYGDGGFYGTAAPLSRLIYRGFLEDWTEYREQFAVDIVLSPYARLLDMTPLPAGLTVQGDVAQIARTLVQTYATALTWDSRNNGSAGVYLGLGALDLSRETLGGALAKLRDLAGANWFAYCTPHGTVRFFQPDPTATATHELTEGLNATAADLTAAGVNRVKQVDVIYAGGNSVTARALDYAAYPTRVARVVATEIADAGTAMQLATAKLLTLDRMVFRGAVSVHSPYDFDAIEVGDTVALRVERPLFPSPSDFYGGGTYGDGGFYGSAVMYGSTPVIVAAVTYNGFNARLELGQPQPRTEDQAARIGRKLETILAQGH